jgi:hypothetical protein
VFRRQAESTVTSPLVRAEFEGGSIGQATFVAPGHLRFYAAAGTSPRPLWFHFAVEGVTLPALRCDLVNADECFGPRRDWANVRPVFSADGRNWERLVRAEYVEETPDLGYFSFTVPIVGPSTQVAYCYPYTTEDLRRALNSVPDRRGLLVDELCRSSEDRTVAYLRFGNHTDPERNVWILARQHAGETPASYVVEGLIQWFCRLDPPVLESLADTAFHLVPMVDVDGVVHGRYGKDQRPVDYNRDWREHPTLPEIKALVAAMRETQDRASLAVVVDIHAPHHGDAECYLFGSDFEHAPAVSAMQSRFVKRLAAVSPESVDFREDAVRGNPNPPGSAREFLRQAFDVPVLTLEVSYHRGRSGRYLTQRDYRDFGAAVGQALHHAFHTPEGAPQPGL